MYTVDTHPEALRSVLGGAPIWFWFSPINTVSWAASGQRRACHLAHMTGCPPGSSPEPHQPPLPPTPPQKKPVAFVLLNPKGFKNLPSRLKKWVPKNQLDKGCSPGPEPACGAQWAIPGHHVSPRLRYAAMFARDRWHPGQEMASVQGGRSRPCGVTWQFSSKSILH